MYLEKKIGVVIPAYNEEKLIGKVIETMPDYVDLIVVVDDQSQDRTVAVVQSLATSNKKIVCLEHERNRGVGAAIATGYIWARDHQVDVTAVMAADFQMDPEDLPRILAPVCKNECDYTKGNRLF
ncbi:Glycosyl transferase family 2, partial [Candidatus Electrothrix marina]